VASAASCGNRTEPLDLSGISSQLECLFQQCNSTVLSAADFHPCRNDERRNPRYRWQVRQLSNAAAPA